MNTARTVGLLVLSSCFLSPVSSDAQTFTQRGFLETRGFLFPQDAPNDTGNIVVDLIGREELFAKVTPWLQLAAGVEVRANSHDQVEGSWRPDFRDRERLRPALSVRRLSATLTRGPLTIDAGKQFIRWGTTDIVTPTDRFAPRDFINVVDAGFLPVTGARAMVQAGAETIDVVWAPWFTPSRVPLLDQRWTVVPDAGAAFSLADAEPSFPTRAQAGLRWSHAGSGYEYSVSFFDGVNHLPDVDVLPGTGPLDLAIARRYSALRMYGGDGALPTRWVTAKGEAAYFTSADPRADEYVLYVIQVERQTGEWLLLGGYAGEAVTRHRAAATFAPDRGMTRSIIARASYTIDPNRSVAIESAVRQNGDGVYAKGEYSWMRGQHWRTTLTGAVIRGERDDFLGQYRRNSHVQLALRYSF